jgi:hypothetical protein
MTNPFRPGNGIEPRYLAGRDDIINSFETSLHTYEEGLPRNATISGLRGTGKTVLLRYFKVLSESRKWLTVEREFNERFQDESEFAEAFVQDLISKATEVSLLKRLKETGKRVAEILKPEELQIYGVTYKPFYKTKKQLLEDYLKEMLVKNWSVFEKSDRKGIVFLYDEFHTVRDRKERKSFPLASLLSAISYAQRNGCRYFLCLGGLPIMRMHLKDAKTYTERMFESKEVGNLSADEAKAAISNTLKDSDYEFDSDLTARIVNETRGYPYFIQFYGYFAIEHVNKSKISLKDFEGIRQKLIRELDLGFFEARYNSASEKEKKILRAMARSSSVDIEIKEIKRYSRFEYDTLKEMMRRLIEKGLIFRTERAKYSFTIPLFRDYLLRQ